MSLGAARLAMLIGALLVVLGWWQRDRLPKAAELDRALRADPLQTSVSIPPFQIDVGGVCYIVRLLSAYELWGLVVSEHDSRTWWDSIHREWNDHLDAVDLCVVEDREDPASHPGRRSDPLQRMARRVLAPSRRAIVLPRATIDPR